MNLLEIYLARTGKQPSSWTSQDIQNYINFVKTQMTNNAADEKYGQMHSDQQSS